MVILLQGETSLVWSQKRINGTQRITFYPNRARYFYLRWRYIQKDHSYFDHVVREVGSGNALGMIWHQALVPQMVRQLLTALIWRIICELIRVLKLGLNEFPQDFSYKLINHTSGLTHWGRVRHIFVGYLTIIGPDNGLSPGRRQAIIWTNAGILSIGPLGTNFSEILIEIYTFSFKKMHWKMLSGKWRSFCVGLNVLMQKRHTIKPLI